MNKKEDHHDDHEYMNLLGIHTTNDNHIVLLFSGNKQVKIGITDVLVFLETITLFSPKRALTIEDLPAFGRPTIAILMGLSWQNCSIQENILRIS